MTTLAPGQLFDPATFSPEQAAMLNNVPGQSLSATNSASTISSAMNLSPNVPAAYVNPTQPVALPGGQTTTDYKSLLAGTAVSLPPPPTDGNGSGTGTDALSTAQSAVDKNQSDITSAMTSLGQQSADQVNLENTLGVTGDKKALADLQAQLVSLNNEADASKISAEGQPIEMNSITGQQNRIDHERTIKALGISSSIQAIQGNLNLANDQVTKALALKYDPIKANIDTLNKQLEFNYKSLSTEQQKQADALKAQNDMKLKQLDILQAKEKDWETTKNVALSNSAPMPVVQKAQALRDAGNEDGARALLAAYTGTKSNDANGGAGGGALGNYTDTAPGGQQYVNVSNLTAAEKSAVLQAARTSGIPILDTAGVGKINAIAETRDNLTNIESVLKNVLPGSGLSRLFVGPWNTLSSMFQANGTGSYLASFKAFRTAAINSVQALAGGTGSGLRINQAEINAAINNDIPTITDTKETAQKKLAVLRGQLSNWESILLPNTGKTSTATPAVSGANGKNPLGI